MEVKTVHMLNMAKHDELSVENFGKLKEYFVEHSKVTITTEKH